MQLKILVENYAQTSILFEFCMHLNKDKVEESCYLLVLHDREQTSIISLAESIITIRSVLIPKICLNLSPVNGRSPCFSPAEAQLLRRPDVWIASEISKLHAKHAPDDLLLPVRHR